MKKILYLVVFFALVINYSVFAQDKRNSLSLVIYEVSDSSIRLSTLKSTCSIIPDTNAIFKSPEYEIVLGKINKEEVGIFSGITDRFDVAWESFEEFKLFHKYFVMSPEIYILDKYNVKHYVMIPTKGKKSTELLFIKEESLKPTQLWILAGYELELRNALIQLRNFYER